jgi:hypothetical protein
VRRHGGATDIVYVFITKVHCKWFVTRLNEKLNIVIIIWPCNNVIQFQCNIIHIIIDNVSTFKFFFDIYIA